MIAEPIALQEDAGWLSGIIFPDGKIFYADDPAEGHGDIVIRLKEELKDMGFEFVKEPLADLIKRLTDERSDVYRILAKKGVITWIVEFMDDGTTRFTADYPLSDLQKKKLEARLPAIIRREAGRYRKHPVEPVDESRLIKTAVLHKPSGTVGTAYGGHWDATDDLLKKGIAKTVNSLADADKLTADEFAALFADLEDGYLTDDNRFVTRIEGEAIAREAGQVHKNTPEIHGADIDYRPENLEDDDIGSLSDVAYPDTPRIHPVQGTDGRVLNISLGDQWIGRIQQIQSEIGPYRQTPYWVPMWLPGIDNAPSRFSSAEEAVNWIMQHRMAQRDESLNLVKSLIEDEEFDDFEAIGDVRPNQLQAAVSALTGAGFKVDRAEIQGIKLVVEFSWPYTSGQVYIKGFTRALEVLKPIIPIRRENYVVRHETNKETGIKTAHALIVKTMEDDPDLWRVQSRESDPWKQVYFNGQKVGEAYLLVHAGIDELGERLREEMVDIHLHYCKFNPTEWPNTRNAFGGGPAIVWWSTNRDKLPAARKTESYFPRDLLNLKSIWHT